MAEEMDKIEALFKKLGPIFTTLAGSVAVFYAIGFLIVQCFISSADVAGMIWFSREYYEEAGGRFLVDIIRTPLMKPVFFVLYLTALLFLVPSREYVKGLGTPEYRTRKWTARLSDGHAIRGVLLLGIALTTYFFMAEFEHFAGSSFFVNTAMKYFFWSGDLPNEQKQTILFFSLTVPIVIALGVLLQRVVKFGGNLHVTRTALYLYVIFVAILPISYGRYLYDIKAVPINDPKRMYALSGIRADLSDSTKMWFLGRFGGKYLFLRKDNLISSADVNVANIAIVRTQGVVESLNESDIKNMNFTLERADTLRNLMKPSQQGAFETAAQKVIDDMFR